jgi:hypothetical protein
LLTCGHCKAELIILFVHYIEINTGKLEFAAFRGMGAIRNKIFIVDRILELSYEGEKDLHVKVTNFVRIL